MLGRTTRYPGWGDHFTEHSCRTNNKGRGAISWRRAMLGIRFGLRIGSKLGISAGVGVVLAGGLILSNYMLTEQTHELDAKVNAAETVQKEILNAEVQGRRLLVVDRDVRIAGDVKELDYALGRLDRYLIKSLDVAAKVAAEPENREHLPKIR